MIRAITFVFLFALQSFAQNLTNKQDFYKEALFTTVRVECNGSGGSGTIVYSDNKSDPNRYETFILTNHHVIEECIKLSEEWSSLRKKKVLTETLIV